MARSNSKRWLAIGAAAIVVLGAVAWFLYQRPGAFEGLASGNGRIEATEVDISTKFAGRLAEVLAREGDTVEATQIVAMMDTTELKAQFRKAEADVRHAQQEEKHMAAMVAQRKSELSFAEKHLGRSRVLCEKDDIALEQFQQDETAVKTAKAALAASEASLAEAKAAIEAAVATADEIKAQIDDSVLQSHISGRVLYRLSEPGEVLPAGGKVLTILDLTDVYMTIFLPTKQAGKVDLGTEARIVLDALPDVAIPAKVTFVAPRAQFTPKEVETQTEREKLMFRIKVKIDPELLKAHADRVKTGLPGVAYVRFDATVPWPEQLQRTPRKDQQ